MFVKWGQDEEVKEGVSKWLVNCEVLEHAYSLAQHLVVVLSDEAPHLALWGGWVPATGVTGERVGAATLRETSGDQTDTLMGASDLSTSFLPVAEPSC